MKKIVASVLIMTLCMCLLPMTAMAAQLGSETMGVPATGDPTNLVLVGCLMLLAVAGVVVVIIIRKRF